jgi:hypothetical protein
MANTVECQMNRLATLERMEQDPVLQQQAAQQDQQVRGVSSNDLLMTLGG